METGLGARPTAARVLLAAYDAWLDAVDDVSAPRGVVLECLRKALDVGRGGAVLDAVPLLTARRARRDDAEALRFCQLPRCSTSELRL